MAQAPAADTRLRVETALANIIALSRTGQDGYAAVWDGNKHVQCRRMTDQSFRCEAAGTMMQPSLASVLDPTRIARLTALGWRLDPSFRNYVQVFPSGMPPSRVADRILEAPDQGYAANLPDLAVQTDWLMSEPCPPRNGPSQNLAGMINDAPSMAATAVYGCAYVPLDEDPLPPIVTATDLVDVYGARVTGEVQRLRVNIDRWQYFALDTGAGYVQCGN